MGRQGPWARTSVPTSHKIFQQCDHNRAELCFKLCISTGLTPLPLSFCVCVWESMSVDTVTNRLDTDTRSSRIYSNKSPPRGLSPMKALRIFRQVYTIWFVTEWVDNWKYLDLKISTGCVTGNQQQNFNHHGEHLRITQREKERPLDEEERVPLEASIPHK